MNQSVSDQALIKRYLLGVLPEHEREQFEVRLLIDREFCEAVSMGRTDLIDDYVATALTPDERHHFEDYFLTNPKQFQMVEIARALADRLEIDSKQPESADLRLNPFYVRHLTLIMTLVGIVLFVIALVSWQVMKLTEPGSGDDKTETGKSILQNEVVRINRGSEDSAQPAMTTLPLTLRPLLLRDLSENRSVALPATPSIIELRLELPNDNYPSYKATLKTDGGAELAAVDNLMSQSSNSTKIVLLNLPSWLMQPGSYEIELSGRLPSNEHEQISSYSFEIIGK